MSTRATIETERVRISFARDSQPLISHERRAELAVGGAFAIAAVALPLAAGVPGHFSPVIAALYVLAMALARNVTFDIGAGFTVPTGVVFVPMLFAVPASVVPALVALSFALAMTPAILSRRRSVSRALTAPGNSWFSLGPALVLASFGVTSPHAAGPVLVLALTAQFAGDFAANLARERIRHGVSMRDLTGELRRIYLIDLALAPLGLVVAFAAVGRPWGVLLVAPLCVLLNVFSRERKVRLEALIELNDAYRGTALVLGDVVEADDTYTGEHCKGVVRLAMAVAQELGLDPVDQRRVEFAALLHDVGKIAVPKEIINKPGRLSDEEWAVIKTHTVEGQRMLERVGGLMSEVGQIVRSSHERWDGAGYPDGLVGDQTPLAARIICACDAFDAMTTTRSYRPAMPKQDAVEELARNAGSQFDPRVVAAILRVVEMRAPRGDVLQASATHDRLRRPALAV